MLSALLHYISVYFVLSQVLFWTRFLFGRWSFMVNFNQKPEFRDSLPHNDSSQMNPTQDLWGVRFLQILKNVVVSCGLKQLWKLNQRVWTLYGIIDQYVKVNLFYHEMTFVQISPYTSDLSLNICILAMKTLMFWWITVLLCIKEILLTFVAWFECRCLKLPGENWTVVSEFEQDTPF